MISLKRWKEKLHPLNDIKTICDQLSMSPFFDDIELVVLLLNFLPPKCPPYKRTKDPMAHVIHFKMVMAAICLQRKK